MVSSLDLGNSLIHGEPKEKAVQVALHASRREMPRDSLQRTKGKHSQFDVQGTGRHLHFACESSASPLRSNPDSKAPGPDGP